MDNDNEELDNEPDVKPFEECEGCTCECSSDECPAFEEFYDD